MRLARAILMAALWASLVGLIGCDPQRIAMLEEGLATEADVRAQFGEPHATYAEPDGARTFEYSRQPAGEVAYMITIGKDGKMSALRQVLKPSEFAKVQPGMDKAAVRRLLGRPAKTSRFDLKPDEEHWDWRWLDGPFSKLFSVTFNRNGQVMSSAVSEDPAQIKGSQ